MTLLPLEKSPRMDRENGLRNVGRCGFPFPNQSPENKRFLRLDLREKYMKQVNITVIKR